MFDDTIFHQRDVRRAHLARRESAQFSPGTRRGTARPLDEDELDTRATSRCEHRIGNGCAVDEQERAADQEKVVIAMPRLRPCSMRTGAQRTRGPSIVSASSLIGGSSRG